MVDQNDAWVFPIQWQDGFSEELAFRTEVITSRDGTEQRIAQRTSPRISYEFDSFLNPKGLQRAARMLSERQARKLLVPHPRGSVLLTSDAAQSAAVNVDEVEGWMFPGARVVIQSRDRFELAEIESVTGMTITLTSGLEGSFPAGARLFRAVPGWLADATEIRAQTSRAATVEIEFEADPLETYHADWSAGPPETLNGLELLKVPHQWADTLRVGFEQPFEELDKNRGARDRLFFVGFTVRTTQMSVVLRTPEQMNRIIGLFYRCRGRQKSFYAPALLDEWRPVGDVPSGSNSITVAGRGFYDQFQGSLTYRFFQIAAPGQVQTFGVANVALDGTGNSVLALDRLVPEDIVKDSIMSITWLAEVRFATDTLALDWLTDGVAEATIKLRTLPMDGPAPEPVIG